MRDLIKLDKQLYKDLSLIKLIKHPKLQNSHLSSLSLPQTSTSIETLELQFKDEFAKVLCQIRGKIITKVQFLYTWDPFPQEALPKMIFNFPTTLRSFSSRGPSKDDFQLPHNLGFQS